jgi:hypothetical protein
VSTRTGRRQRPGVGFGPFPRLSEAHVGNLQGNPVHAPGIRGAQVSTARPPLDGTGCSYASSAQRRSSLEHWRAADQRRSRRGVPAWLT